MNSVKEILEDLGYTIHNSGNSNYSCRPLYRDSDNNTALSVCKKTGKYFDFVEGRGGSLESLIKRTLNFEKDEEVEVWLKNKNYQINSAEPKPVLKMSKIFDSNNFFALPHKYFEERGISKDTMKIFGHGVCHGGQMSGRYTFFILEESGSIVGVAGRLVTGDVPDESGRIGKWKILGRKSNFVYPYHVNRLDILNSKQVILLESIGDFLALYDSGFKNGLVMFGVKLSPAIISKLIEINPNKIIIATNNDETKNSAGNNAADEIFSKLSNFFDSNKIYKGCPVGANDLFELYQREGKIGICQWYNSLFLN